MKSYIYFQSFFLWSLLSLTFVQAGQSPNLANNNPSALLLKDLKDPAKNHLFKVGDTLSIYLLNGQRTIIEGPLKSISPDRIQVGHQEIPMDQIYGIKTAPKGSEKTKNILRWLTGIPLTGFGLWVAIILALVGLNSLNLVAAILIPILSLICMICGGSLMWKAWRMGFKKIGKRFRLEVLE